MPPAFKEPGSQSGCAHWWCPFLTSWRAPAPPVAARCSPHPCEALGSAERPACPRAGPLPPLQPPLQPARPLTNALRKRTCSFCSKGCAKCRHVGQLLRFCMPSDPHSSADVRSDAVFSHLLGGYCFQTNPVPPARYLACQRTLSTCAVLALVQQHSNKSIPHQPGLEPSSVWCVAEACPAWASISSLHRRAQHSDVVLLLLGQQHSQPQQPPTAVA